MQLRLDGIVPFAMKGIAKQVEGSKLVISHLESSRIGIAVLEYHYRQAFIRCRMRASVRGPLPVRSAVSPASPMEMKENKRCSIVFQGHGSRWIMGDGNGKLFFVGKFLQLLFPQAVLTP